MKKKINGIFFMCSGFGLGNSARISAVIDEITKIVPERKIHVLTWGPAVSFFRQHPKYNDIQIVKLRSYSLSSTFLKEHYLVTMLMTALASPLRYLENSLIILRYARKHRPDLVVFDSDYHFFPFFLIQKPIMVSINQSYNAVIGFFHFSFRHQVKTSPSFVIEALDAVAQLLFADRVFVPSIRQHKSYLFKKITALPLIVRQVFLSRNEGRDLKPVALCLGGSGLQWKSLALRLNQPDVDVLRVENGEFHKNIYPVPRIMNYEEVVCQGGLSTISEVLATGRKITVVPIAGHCEQYSNFYDVARIESKSDYSNNPRNFEGSKIIADEMIEYFEQSP